MGLLNISVPSEPEYASFASNVYTWWELVELVRIIRSPFEPEYAYLMRKVVMEKIWGEESPLGLIASYLGIPMYTFLSSRTWEQPGTGRFRHPCLRMLQTLLLRNFVASCTFNGRAHLPTVLSDATVCDVATASYVWHSWLRSPCQSWALLRHGSDTWSLSRWDVRVNKEVDCMARNAAAASPTNRSDEIFPSGMVLQMPEIRLPSISEEPLRRDICFMD